MGNIIEELEGMPGERLTAIEIARVLGIHRNTVYNWHRNGLLPGGFKVGGTLRFDKGTVIEHIKLQQGRE